MTVQQLERGALVVLLVLALGGSFASIAPVRAQPDEALDIGDTMPMVQRSMPTATAGRTTLGAVQGERGILVIFWSNTCPWADRYEDRLGAIARDFLEQDIGMIAVNPNDATAYPGEGMAEMRKRANAADYPFPYAVDEGSELARAFGASRTPEVYLFNADGELVYKGTIDDNPRSAEDVTDTYLRDALSGLTAGSEISRKRTRPFGCTIKWQ